MHWQCFYRSLEDDFADDHEGDDEGDDDDMAGNAGEIACRPWSMVAIIGAIIIRLGFWGPVYYRYNKEPPKYIKIL